MDISSIPNIRQRANLIIVLTVAGLILQAVYTAVTGITTLNALVWLISLGVKALLLYGLILALRPAAYKGLGILSVTFKVRFIIDCVILGLMGLISVLLLILLIGYQTESGEFGVVLFFWLMPVCMMFIRTVYNAKIAKTAKQLNTDSYTPSQSPENWAIACAAAELIYLIAMLILYFAAPTIPEAEEGGKVMQLIAQLAQRLSRRGQGLGVNIPGWVSDALTSAGFFAVYLLLSTLRLNSPAHDGKKQARKR